LLGIFWLAGMPHALKTGELANIKVVNLKGDKAAQGGGWIIAIFIWLQPRSKLPQLPNDFTSRRLTV
jgi:hypothetical protein